MMRHLSICLLLCSALQVSESLRLTDDPAAVAAPDAKDAAAQKQDIQSIAARYSGEQAASSAAASLTEASSEEKEEAFTRRLNLEADLDVEQRHEEAKARQAEKGTETEEETDKEEDDEDEQKAGQATAASLLQETVHMSARPMRINTGPRGQRRHIPALAEADPLSRPVQTGANAGRKADDIWPSQGASLSEAHDEEVAEDRESWQGWGSDGGWTPGHHEYDFDGHSHEFGYEGWGDAGSLGHDHHENFHNHWGHEDDHDHGRDEGHEHHHGHGYGHGGEHEQEHMHGHGHGSSLTQETPGGKRRHAKAASAAHAQRRPKAPSLAQANAAAHAVAKHKTKVPCAAWYSSENCPPSCRWVWGPGQLYHQGHCLEPDGEVEDRWGIDDAMGGAWDLPRSQENDFLEDGSPAFESDLDEPDGDMGDMD
eukprot:TRINITY_DN3899_c0_g1_i1.p1 TRINITY_DN3899_c0_g1~~TRINITY_DN3899_c0_g1_i1.p1  ORF type:complete len:426 (-),score=103.71 TRINITY_DN3899_c0_g1_i1:46-1323(-)